MPVDTRKVRDRRSLRFNSLRDALDDAHAIALSERAGNLRRTGNWTAGQIFGHLAAWCDYAFDGYPPDVRIHPIARFLFRMLRSIFTHRKVPVGIVRQAIPGGTHATDLLSVDDGLQRLTRAFNRLEHLAPTLPNPALGPLTHEEWIGLNLRHAELHFSFLFPAPDSHLAARNH